MQNSTPVQVAAMISASVLIAAASFWFNRPSANSVPQAATAIDQQPPEPPPTGVSSPEAPPVSGIAITVPEALPSSDGLARSVVVKPVSGNCWQLLKGDFKTVEACLPKDEEIYRLGESKGNWQKVRSLKRNLTGWMPQEALY